MNRPKTSRGAAAAALLLWLAAMQATAQGSAASCEGIESAEARLACYDRLAQCVAIEDPALRLRCFEDPLAFAVPAASRPSPPVEAPHPAAPATAESPAPVDDEPSAEDLSPAEAEAAAAAAAAAPVEVPDATPASTAAESAAPEDDPFPVKGRGRVEGDDGPELTAVIERIRRDPRDIVYLFLDNGQVWRETARSNFRYEEGMAVTITQGTFGSTNLKAEGMKKYAKVRRVE